MILLFHDLPQFASSKISGVNGLEKQGYHTSKYFRTTQRPPATDLRGVHTSDDSFETSMKRLAEACRVDFQLGLFWYAAAGSTA